MEGSEHALAVAAEVCSEDITGSIHSNNSSRSIELNKMRE
jgi:hypothetical protein